MNVVTNNSNPASYIVAPTTSNAVNPVTTGPIESSTANALTEIKIICSRKKKKSKRHIQLTFIESRSLSSPTEQPCIELINKKSGASQSTNIYLLNECLSFEYFDTVKNDFQAFIYVYFESFTVSIYFSDDLLEKKPLIIKHLEAMTRTKSETTQDVNGNPTSNAMNNNNVSDQTQINIQPASPQSILPCPSTTEHILHTFDVQLVPFGTIISRDHPLIGPARLYFTTTDLYLAPMDCKRSDLKVTIANQCPSKDKVILCIPYFTIKNYGNRSNIFLIELGKSTYGNGEVHMKCQSSSLASTIHLLVSPVIEERPLILSSAFQNQLLTHKRIEKSKNIQPPIQLSNDATNPTANESSVPLLKQKSIDTIPSEHRNGTNRSNDFKSRLVVGFFRSLTKNVAHLRRSATFHQSSNCNNSNKIRSSLDKSLPLKTSPISVKIDEKILCNDQHQIVLPETQKKVEPTINVSQTNQNKVESDVHLLPAPTVNTNGTYIDMGPTTIKADENQSETLKDETVVHEQTTSTVEIGVNTIISLSPHVRSAIIVGNSVHLIADEKSFFPIGQRSFTSPASVMQPFKAQLSGQSSTVPYVPSSNMINSSPNSSNSLQQGNSVSNSQQSLLLSYGIVTFNNNNFDLTANEQSERATSPPSDGSVIDRRLNSDLSLISSNQQQTSNGVSTLENVLCSSSSQIFRTLSLSTSNIGDTNNPFRTSHGSIILLDDHPTDQTTTYLLGPPISLIEEPTSSSSNLTTSISRAHLTNIDEEKSFSLDPYALVEAVNDSVSSALLNNVEKTSKTVEYAEILPVDQTEHGDYSSISLDQNDQKQDSNEFHHDEHDERQRSSTLLYSNIDFNQTHRRDRIAQFAAKAKLDDKTPPFLL